MAGIAGIQSDDRTGLVHMLDLFKHRCSQEVEINQEYGISLGSCELSVGEKPKAGFHRTSDGRRAIILDGRVYNPETANMTDAEAVLYFYDKFGTQFAKKIDGDFACAISDQGKLILARDALGVKSLYYGHSDGKLCFASEAKSLVDIADDVTEFPPGYVYSQELGFQKYTCQVAETPDFENFEQAKNALAQLLEEATEKRMKDNAVGGILLTGGSNSSIIAYIAKEIKPDIETFTVSMEEEQDRLRARDVAKYLGTKHHELVFSEKEIIEVLPRAIYHIEMFEESCVRDAIANFLAGRFVSPYTNCVLTGEGADEFLAGYDAQFGQGKNPEEIASIVDRLANVAHNTALQRLDRLSAANGIETRMPFLDAKVVDFSLKIPLSCKIHGPEQVGKWILRKAFEGRLPDHIIYRTKRFFAQGSGIASIMRAQADKHISAYELAEHNSIASNPWLTSVEELYYYRIFKETFPHPAFDRLVGRWDPARPDFFRR